MHRPFVSASKMDKTISLQRNDPIAACKCRVGFETHEQNNNKCACDAMIVCARGLRHKAMNMKNTDSHSIVLINTISEINDSLN